MSIWTVGFLPIPTTSCKIHWLQAMQLPLSAKKEHTANAPSSVWAGMLYSKTD